MILIMFIVILIPFVFLISNNIRLENKFQNTDTKLKSCLKKTCPKCEKCPKKVQFKDFDIVKTIPTNSEPYTQGEIYNKYDASMNTTF